MLSLFKYPVRASRRSSFNIVFGSNLLLILIVGMAWGLSSDFNLLIGLAIALFVGLVTSWFSLYWLEKEADGLAGIYDRAINRIEGALNAQSIGVLLIDEQDNVFWWNDSAKRLLGINSHTDRGQRVFSIINNPQFERFFISGEYISVLEMEKPGDLPGWVEVEVAPYDTSGKMLVIRDITGLKRLETIRSDFASNVAHQLKTPLSVIQGYADIAFQYAELEQVPPLKVMKKITNQVNRMNELIRDMLVLSRIETGRANLIMSELNMPQLMRELHDETSKYLEIRNQKLKLSIDEGTEEIIKGNTGLLRTAFTQLIENASKYSPKGSKIRMSWIKESRGLVLTVSDKGAGIESELIPRLTERFFRGDHNEKGSGLGLAIVKHVMGLHGAELVITSEVGKGSQFSCVFEPQRKTITRQAFSSGLTAIWSNRWIRKQN